MPVAVDGCGVPTFALPLDRCAHAFARLPRLDGGPRVVAAMRAHPEMLARARRGRRAAHARASTAGSRRVGPRGCSAPVRADGLGHRAQGRGRRLPRHSPCTCRIFGRARHRPRRARHRHGGKQPRRARRGGPDAAKKSCPKRLISRIGFARCKGEGPIRGDRQAVHRDPGLVFVNPREEGVHALRRDRFARCRGTAQARRARAGEGIPHLRRDRQRARGRRVDEGAARGVHHLRDRPFDRARRGRAAQAASARARSGRGREGGAEARPQRRAVARLAPALPA